MTQATSSLFTEVGGGTHFYGSDVYSGQGDTERVESSNGDRMTLTRTSQGYSADNRILLAADVLAPNNPRSNVLQSPEADRIGKILTGGSLPEHSPGYTASTRSLIMAISKNPAVSSEIDAIWKVGVARQVETGVWVYRNNATGALITVRMPLGGATYREMRPGPPPNMPGYTVLLTVHTHLDPSPVYGSRYDYPSDQDVRYSVDHDILGLIKNDQGLVPYGPSPLPPPPKR